MPDYVVRTVPLEDLIQLQSKQRVSVRAIIYEVEPTWEVNCADSNLRLRRQVSVVDPTKRILTLTVWQEHTTTLEDKEGSCILFKNMEIRDFRQIRGLTTTPQTEITVLDPADPDAKHLLEWWGSEGRLQEFRTLELNPADIQPPADI